MRYGGSNIGRGDHADGEAEEAGVKRLRALTSWRVAMWLIAALLALIAYLLFQLWGEVDRLRGDLEECGVTFPCEVRLTPNA